MLSSTSTTFSVQQNETKHVEITKSGEYIVELLGPGAHADIHGAFLTTGKESVDIQLYIVHKSAHTTAQTMLKGVARDSSSIRFFGRIKIEPGCPNTQSFLEERILLLSDQAKAEAVPELEILSDDVKCSHAASVSPVPEEHLFYLMSRGLDTQTSENLVIEGFLSVPSTEDIGSEE